MKKGLSILLVLCTLMCMLLTGCGGSIKLTDYLTVSEVKGCDGYGYVEYELDKEALGKVIKANLKSDDELTSTIGAGMIVEAIDIKVENNGTFSNGDTVKVTVSLEGEYKVKKKLVGGTITKKVSGLKEVKTVDLFDDFSDIKFDGKNSLGSMDFSEKTAYKNDVFADIRSSITYTTENNGALTNGDKITVKAIMSDYENNNKLLLEQGYAALEEQTKEITVSGLWETMTRNQVNDDFLARLETAFKEKTQCQSITNAYYFWGEATDEYEKNKNIENSIFYYVGYIDKNGKNKLQCWYFTNCHLTANTEDQPFEDFGLSFYTVSSGTPKKTLQEALSAVEQQTKRSYEISVIK